MVKKPKPDWTLRVLEKPEDMAAIEELQRKVWPGSETDVVPLHILTTVAHNGGLVIGAFGDSGSPAQNSLIGFVFGFPGLYFTPDGPRPKHCSHQLGIHPGYRNRGVGFALKRAQWQMVRHQGLDRITWTFDPLLSPNAQLNIAKLGGVCNIYQRDVYGDMRDGLNAGSPSDRFQVDWWVNSQRVYRRLSKRARPALDLAHFLAAGAVILNPSHRNERGWPLPDLEISLHLAENLKIPSKNRPGSPHEENSNAPILLVEIPSDFQALREAEPELGLEWRMQTRLIFEDLFAQGYLVTDFVYLPGNQPRSFYGLSHGEATL